MENDRGIEKVTDLDFSVQSGEIFGIAGVDGNGQTELIEAITGLQEVADGRIEFDGVDVTDDPRRSRMARGLSYIPGERQEQALVLDFDLVKNAVLGNQHRSTFSDGRRIDWDAARAHTEEIIRTYDVRPPDPSATARSLSGGNQQKFVVGREFSRDPDTVVAAHPTRGVDIGSMEFIHDQLLRTRERGVAILFASFDSLQLRLQQIPELDVPSALFGVLPSVVVILVLTLIGGTRLPAALGEHYDEDE